MPRDAEEDISKDAPSWCLVVNSSPNSLVRSRRGLHNMLMQLEREGAAVVDRPMSCVDLALSVTTCCCIWTEQSLKVPFHLPHSSKSQEGMGANGRLELPSK